MNRAQNIIEEGKNKSLYCSSDTFKLGKNKILTDIDRLIYLRKLYALSVYDLIKDDTSMKNKITTKNKINNLLISVGMVIVCIGFFLPDSVSFFTMILGFVLILFSQDINEFLSKVIVHTK